MVDKIKVAVLGSTGFVGLELVNILAKHPNVEINFLGSENYPNENIVNFNNTLDSYNLPKLSYNKDFKPSFSEVVFLSLPHGISHQYVKNFYNKLKIIDLSADFRLDSDKIYNENYEKIHLCPELLDKFVYGLPEINKNNIKNSSNISVPGCYPTSILLPLIPILKNNLINPKNIIIDSKSGYSGAGKKFNLKNIKNSLDYNFYNYNTNTHRHICEIKQELLKNYNNKINFSFNPHILPVYRGMMSTIYVDLNDGILLYHIQKILIDYYKNSKFVKILDENNVCDFFSVQHTNNCLIKLFKHHSDNKIIIVSLIDNLIKGAAGQAVQCFNIISNFDEEISLTNLK